MKKSEQQMEKWTLCEKKFPCKINRNYHQSDKKIFINISKIKNNQNNKYYMAKCWFKVIFCLHKNVLLTLCVLWKNVNVKMGKSFNSNVIEVGNRTN